MRITRKRIESAILKETGLSVKIKKEWNYFWFYSDIKSVQNILSLSQETSVCVFNLCDLSIDQWVSDFTKIYQDGIDCL